MLNLPSGQAELDALLVESDFHGCYTAWRTGREVINTHIESDAAVLDVACANGLLLASLLEWHPDVFMPYGFDVSANRIRSARELMPAFAAHFHVHNLWSSPWPVRKADIVIAPWINRTSYVARCLNHARMKVIFTVYDDKLSGGLDLQRECQTCGLERIQIDTVGRTTHIAIVRPRDIGGIAFSRAQESSE